MVGMKKLGSFDKTTMGELALRRGDNSARGGKRSSRILGCELYQHFLSWEDVGGGDAWPVKI